MGNIDLSNVAIRNTFPSIDVEDLLYGLDNLDAWNFILGFYVSIGEKFRNPFRNDSKPGAYLYQYNDKVLLADWGHIEFHGISFPQALKYIYPGCSFGEQLIKFSADYVTKRGIVLKPNPYYISYKNSSSFVITSTPRKWQRRDAAFWTRYDIHSNQLEFEDVCPIESYTHNSRMRPYDFVTITPQDPAYSIHINSREKVYRPFSMEKKWINSLHKEDVGGKIPCSGNILFIKKSYKDYQVVVNQGYNARYILNEGVMPVKFLQKAVKEFSIIIPLMDNDKAGRAAAKKYETYINSIGGKAYGCWLETEEKDPSDLIASKGKDVLKYSLESIIDTAKTHITCQNNNQKYVSM